MAIGLINTVVSSYVLQHRERVNKEIGEGALVQLRAYIAQGEFALNDRLPPERELCEKLGIARAELRKAFAVLEAEGAIWRHVGRGTFVANGQGHGADFQSIAAIAKRTTPQQVMYARLVLEPQLAREAALCATAEHVEQLHDICAKARRADTWRQYETLDNRFHSLVTEATQNTPTDCHVRPAECIKANGGVGQITSTL